MVGGVHGNVTHVHVVEHRDVLEVVTAPHLLVEEKIVMVQVFQQARVVAVLVSLYAKQKHSAKTGKANQKQQLSDCNHSYTCD